MKIYRVTTMGTKNYGHIPALPGAYILSEGNKCYVGSSKNLRVRLRTHASRKFGEWEMRFFVDSAYRRREQKIIEDLLCEPSVQVVNRCNAIRALKERHRRSSFRSVVLASGISYGTAISRKRKGLDPFVKPTRHLRMITIKGVTKPMSQWCRETGISIELALGRIKLGWSVERAVTEKKKRIS